MSITYSDSVFVALGIQHATHMRRILCDSVTKTKLLAPLKISIRCENQRKKLSMQRVGKT
jgi:hypothetical protein